MSDIFISYAREDRGRAEQLARAFERQGWTVWWDKVIPPGRKFADVIGEELASARAVIVLWSSASVASDWVKDEAQEGATRGLLVPVLVEKVSPPYGFRQVQTADLSEWDGSQANAELQGLLSGVADMIKKPVTKAAPEPILKDDARPRRTWLYALAALVLVSALGFAAYRLLTSRGGGGGDTGSGGDTGAGIPGPRAPCSIEARNRATNTTIEGLQLIDPDGKHNLAVIKFEQAIAECPDYANAYFFRAQSYVMLDKSDMALDDFKTVLKLSPDRDTERQARKFIADLEGPHSTPPHNSNAGTSNGGGANTSTANTVATNANGAANTNGPQKTPTPADPGATRAQVADIFVADKTKRISATTRLIIERKQDAAAVKQAIASAIAQPDNKSGVINTLVYLENVDPAILKQFRADIEKLFAVTKGNGSQTVEHIEKVQERMGG